jgi:hypothetical protein
MLVVILLACATGEEDHYVRGHKLRVAALPPDARASAYEAALGAAFELSDPALTLLLDPRVLPREGGFDGQNRLPRPVERVMRAREIVRGVCEPPLTTSRKTPQCAARGPGYVVRFSDVLRRGGDSIEVYLAVQKFDTPESGASESLRFERAYQLVPKGPLWVATHEARVRR